MGILHFAGFVQNKYVTIYNKMPANDELCMKMNMNAGKCRRAWPAAAGTYVAVNEYDSGK